MNNSQKIAQDLVDADIDVRSCIRAAAGCRGASTRISVIPGSSRPRTEGDPGYRTWTPNPDGTRVWACNPRWRTYYHCSTERITVGWTWIRRHCPVPWTAFLAI